jgi:hypothetical protein
LGQALPDRAVSSTHSAASCAGPEPPRSGSDGWGANRGPSRSMRTAPSLRLTRPNRSPPGPSLVSAARGTLSPASRGPSTPTNPPFGGVTGTCPTVSGCNALCRGSPTSGFPTAPAAQETETPLGPGWLSTFGGSEVHHPDERCHQF